MLEDKLKHSRKQSNNKALIVWSVILMVIALGGLLTAELVLKPDDLIGKAHIADLPQQAEGQPLVDDRQEDFSRPIVVVEGATSLSQLKPDQQGQASEKDRFVFKTLLSEYEARIKDLVEAPEFGVWDAAAQTRFLKMKDQVMADFGAGKYSRASSGLSALVRDAEKAIAERDDVVAESVRQTTIALKDNDPHKALDHFSRAKELAPHSQEVSTLEPRVSVLPQVVNLLEEAHVSQVQGDIEGELAAWKKIAKLDPTHSKAKSRISSIQGSLFEQELSKHFQKAIEAIEARRPDEAQKSLDKAIKMAPKRDEVAHLQREIDTLGKELRYNELIKQATAYEAADDWSKALSTFNAAASINPSSAEVANGIKRSRTVLGLHAAIREKLEKPYRLSTKVGERQALALLEKVGGIFEISPSLVSLSKKLEGILEVYTTPVVVCVTSDGKTFVQVKGVGKVGQVTEKNIRIRPGRYLFEGKRDGFVSKATEVEIPPSGKTVVVHVACEKTI